MQPLLSPSPPLPPYPCLSLSLSRLSLLLSLSQTLFLSHRNGETSHTPVTSFFFCQAVVHRSAFDSLFCTIASTACLPAWFCMKQERNLEIPGIAMKDILSSQPWTVNLPWNPCFGCSNLPHLFLSLSLYLSPSPLNLFPMSLCMFTLISLSLPLVQRSYHSLYFPLYFPLYHFSRSTFSRHFLYLSIYPSRGCSALGVRG